MKKIPLLTMLFIISIVFTASAAVICYTVQVDQDTKMYLGTDAVNYLIVPSGGNYGSIRNSTQVVFSITSSAVTGTSNLRIGFQTSPSLIRDSDGQKLQGCAPNVIGNYYLTKSTTIPLN